MRFFNEFKKFISRGNVVDLAVGVMIGSAFTAIVNSVVNDVVMPFISLITGGLDFSSWVLVLSGGPEPVTINYGSLVSAAINFLAIAVILFCVVKAMNRFYRKDDKPATVSTKKCPFCRTNIDVDATRCPHCTSELPVEEAVND